MVPRGLDFDHHLLPVLVVGALMDLVLRFELLAWLLLDRALHVVWPFNWRSFDRGYLLLSGHSRRQSLFQAGVHVQVLQIVVELRILERIQPFLVDVAALRFRTLSCWYWRAQLRFVVADPLLLGR